MMTFLPACRVCTLRGLRLRDVVSAKLTSDSFRSIATRSIPTRSLSTRSIPTRSLSTSEAALNKDKGLKDLNDDNVNDNSATVSASTTGPPVVYSGTMTQTVYAVKHFSLFSSTLIAVSQPFIWDKMAALNSPILQSAIGGGLAFFFLGTPLLIHSFTRKYVIELTLDLETKKFEAYTYSIFLRKKKLEFLQSDITIPPTPLPFTTIHAKGKPLLLDPNGWKSRYAYDLLMLMDKDSVDWSKIKKE